MGRSITESFIEKMIGRSRDGVSDYWAKEGQENHGNSPVENAIYYSERGYLAETGSNLARSEVPLPRKGEIMAMAYATSAEDMAKLAGYTNLKSESREKYQRLAQKRARIAQALTRAATIVRK